MTIPEELRDAALKLRNDPDTRFAGTESPEDIALAVLEDELAELEEDREAAEEKQAELREKIGVASGDDDADAAELSEAAAKRAELRDKMGQ